MSLWIDKYKPCGFGKLDYHLEQAVQLENLAECDDFPHMVIYGPTGAGKRTRINCMLRSIYGTGASNTKINLHTFETPSGSSIEISTIASNYHIEVTPSSAGFHDRTVIQELVKTVAQTQQFDTVSQKCFKVIVINGAESLTEDAQHALRRTMEKYTSTCRLILVSTSISALTPAIRSRCLAIRVAAPTTEEIVKVLIDVAKKERLNLTPNFAKRIAENSDRNLRAAVLMLESCRVQQYPFTEDQKIYSRDWQLYLREMAILIVKEQSPEMLLQIRDHFYELLSKCIPKDVIFKEIYRHLLPKCIGSTALMPYQRLTQLTVDYEKRSNMGSKTIYHLEAWVANLMAAILKHRDAMV